MLFLVPESMKAPAKRVTVPCMLPWNFVTKQKLKVIFALLLLRLRIYGFASIYIYIYSSTRYIYAGLKQTVYICISNKYTKLMVVELEFSW